MESLAIPEADICSILPKIFLEKFEDIQYSENVFLTKGILTYPYQTDNLPLILNEWRKNNLDIISYYFPRDKKNAKILRDGNTSAYIELMIGVLTLPVSNDKKMFYIRRIAAMAKARSEKPMKIFDKSARKIFPLIDRISYEMSHVYIDCEDVMRVQKLCVSLIEDITGVDSHELSRIAENFARFRKVKKNIWKKD